MATRVTFNLIDHSGEMTKTVVWLEDIAGDGSNWADILVSVGLMEAALLVATECNHVSTVINYETGNTPAVPPAEVIAQREIAIRVKMVDVSTGDYTSFTVPGPAEGFYPPTGVKGDYIPLSNAIFAALILVLEANLVSPDGNAVEVVEGRLIGRNS